MVALIESLLTSLDQFCEYLCIRSLAPITPERKPILMTKREVLAKVDTTEAARVEAVAVAAEKTTEASTALSAGIAEINEAKGKIIDPVPDANGKIDVYEFDPTGTKIIVDAFPSLDSPASAPVVAPPVTDPNAPPAP